MAKFQIKNIKTSEEFDSYIAFIDNEIKLLNDIRSVIISRVALDKDYARNIVKNTLVKKTYNLDGFVIEKSWNSIQDLIGDTSTEITESCTRTERDIIPRLTCIIKEKEAAKRKLIDEKARYDRQLKQLKSELESARSEYSKAVGKVNDAKRDYLNAIRSPKITEKQVKKLLDEIIMYGSKMHVSHNNYLLALKKFNNETTLLREKLFPNLVSSHQEIQEKMLEELKYVLNAFHNHLNFSRPELQQLYNAIDHEVSSIEPFRDYRDNVVKCNSNNNNNTYNPPLYSDFADFDQTLIALAGDFIQPLLHVNVLSVTAPTFSGLNDKKVRFTQDYHEVEQKLAQINSEYQKAQTSDMQFGGPSLSTRVKLIDLQKDKLEYEIIKDVIKQTLDELSGQVGAFDDGRNNPQDISVKTTVYEDRPILHTIPSRESFIPKLQGMLPSFNRDKNFDHDVDLVDQPWFHGVLPRKEVESDLLKCDGDFLVRESSNAPAICRPPFNVTQYVVSLKCFGNNRFTHYIIYQNIDSKKYKIDESGLEFDKISQMLEYYVNEKDRSMNDSGIRFVRPVPRESWEIRDNDLTYLKEIDSGNFGVVQLGKFKNKMVAIKSLKFDEKFMTSEKQEKEKFLAEGRLLQKYSHKNIVRFIGIAIDTDPIKIVMEYIDGGSLHKYLEKNYDTTTKQLLKFCEECASGMQYLEKNRVIHRDLAARNCLLTKDLELKITDFGLSRQLEDDENSYIMSCIRPIPIRWSAPEALRGKFTTKSDVWSYGVTAWEIFSNATIPYNQYQTNEVRQRIQTGEKLTCPTNCDPKIYADLMEPCWMQDPESRPDFTKILRIINQLYKTANMF